MIVEYIRYTIPEPERAGFEAAYARAGAALAASEHCLAYELAACDEDLGSYVLRIEWDSADGHLKGFRGSPEFQAFLADVRPYIGSIAEMRHYHVTPVRLRK